MTTDQPIIFVDPKQNPAQRRERVFFVFGTAEVQRAIRAHQNQ
jgi:hypothetical protein